MTLELMTTDLSVLRPARSVVVSSNFIYARIYMRRLFHYLFNIHECVRYFNSTLFTPSSRISTMLQHESNFFPDIIALIMSLLKGLLL